MIRTDGINAKGMGHLSGFAGSSCFSLWSHLLIISWRQLVTGNMMAVSMALYAKEITLKQWVRNMFLLQCLIWLAL